VFGAFLVVTGMRMAVQRHQHADPSGSRVLRLVRQVVPSTDEYDGPRFWIRRGGRWLATPLFAVLVLVEVTDVVFAVDSIPAVFAVTQEPFLVFTSNAFAILGLRAMYFLLADLIDRFVLLKLGLSVVLVWVGLKMLLLDVYKISTATSLAVVLAVITASVLASLWITRRRARPPVTADPQWSDRAPVARAQWPDRSPSVEATPEVEQPQDPRITVAAVPAAAPAPNQSDQGKEF
jgi:tellurite resistance protein TerC